ncbi:type IV pilus modification PilV family protein [Synoicihabitans lomoniglobus]|uniref:Uncharacterized protein n=1 Tax=Synoicihabitans lomoniglobus TaxID=2909285 RepID=A0AAE9ZUT3_9BACT|nr:hypothetical protein [Opitutaceae bacterium LMO-M01]WED63474.1 hypothetical protein PXH66_14130 [Opitutaceae bacterium LMO-M01]
MKTTRPTDSSPRHNSERGFALIETALGAVVMSMVFAGMMSAFVQSRRLTEGSIFQNSTVTVVQGYLEQIKNMDFASIPHYDGDTLRRGTVITDDANIYTRLDADTLDVLQISPGAPIAKSTVIPGEVPEGVVDNFKQIDINDTPETTADDLNLHVWVWITPLDDADNGVGPSRRIRMVYTWSFNNGGISQTYVDSITTIRSVVPTF